MAVVKLTHRMEGRPPGARDRTGQQEHTKFRVPGSRADRGVPFNRKPLSAPLPVVHYPIRSPQFLFGLLPERRQMFTKCPFRLMANPDLAHSSIRHSGSSRGLPTPLISTTFAFHVSLRRLATTELACPNLS
jgi:hypothetical protein